MYMKLRCRDPEISVLRAATAGKNTALIRLDMESEIIWHIGVSQSIQLYHYNFINSSEW